MIRFKVIDFVGKEQLSVCVYVFHECGGDGILMVNEDYSEKYQGAIIAEVWKAKLKMMFGEKIKIEIEKEVDV